MYAFCFAGLNFDRKKGRPLTKTSRVTFSGEIQCKPTKLNTRKEQMLLKKKKPPKGNSQPLSSDPNCTSVVDKSLSASVQDVYSDPNCTDVVNKDLSSSVLGLYSDDKSTDTSHVCEERAPVTASAVSLEIKNAPLVKTNANSEPVAHSWESETPSPRLTREKTVQDWLFDPCFYIVSRLLLVCQ